MNNRIYKKESIYNKKKSHKFMFEKNILSISSLDLYFARGI